MKSPAPRRNAALLLAMSLLLPGCAPSKDKAGGPKTLVVWMQMDPQERARFEKNLAEYHAKHPDITVQAVPYSTENLRQTFQTAAAGGSGPQLIFGPSDQIGPLSLLQLLKPLDTTMPAGFFDRFVPQSLDTLNEHLWAAPDQVGNHLMVCFNKALVKDAPKDAAEFLRVAKAQTRDGRYGFAMNVDEPYWLAPFLAGFGGWVMDEQSQPTLDTPQMRAALGYVADLKNKQSIMPRESDYQIAETLFKEGKAAMIINGPWSWSGYRKAGIDLGIAPIWTLPNGHTGIPMTASKGYSININVKDSELPAVIDLITYLTSAEAELRDAIELGILPSHKDAWADAAIQSDPYMKISQAGFAAGRRMPVVPEMRVIWDVMRNSQQKVMNGSMKPADASREMQAAAVQQIATMKR